MLCYPSKCYVILFKCLNAFFNTFHPLLTVTVLFYIYLVAATFSIVYHFIMSSFNSSNYSYVHKKDFNQSFSISFSWSLSFHNYTCPGKDAYHLTDFLNQCITGICFHFKMLAWLVFKCSSLVDVSIFLVTYPPFIQCLTHFATVLLGNTFQSLLFTYLFLDQCLSHTHHSTGVMEKIFCFSFRVIVQWDDGLFALRPMLVRETYLCLTTGNPQWRVHRRALT